MDDSVLRRNDGCEIAITATGWGPCHHFLVILCGLCTLAEATASLIVLVVSPLLACDLKFDKNDVILLNGISSLASFRQLRSLVAGPTVFILIVGSEPLCFIEKLCRRLFGCNFGFRYSCGLPGSFHGMALGSFFFGTLTDANGRKSSIPITMVVIFCASVFLSFAHKFIFITFAVFLLGIGTAGNNVALRVYLIECLPAKRRGASLAMLNLLWVVGYLATLGLSWSMVPSVMRMMDSEFRPSSWRVLAGLGGGPSLIMACVVSLLPSTPRYLLYRQHPERAFAVLQQMYAVNNSRHVDNYPPCQLENCIRPDDDGNSESNGFCKRIGHFFVKTRRRIGIICRSSALARTTILASIARLFLFPGLIWLAAWKAHVSLGEDEIPLSEESSVYEYGNSSGCIVDSGDIARGFLRDCHQVNNPRFEYSLLLSTSYILGQGLLVIGLDAVGRRLTIVTSGLVGGTAILALPFAARHTPRILLSIFFLASYSIIDTTTIVTILENYPTSVRGTTIGLTSVLPHLAAFFVKFFGRIYCERSIYVASGLIIGAALAAIPIPDFTRAPMVE